MPFFKLGDGTICHAKMPRISKRDLCAFCGMLSDALCDYRAPGKRTAFCSKPLCGSCAIHVDPDQDFCPDHTDPPATQPSLFGEAA